MDSINDVVRCRLCIGCGLCTFSDSVERTIHHEGYGQSIPLLTESNCGDEVAYEICPGKGYNIVSEANRLFNTQHRTVELGSFHNLYAAYSNDEELRRSASSGGIMSQIGAYLLEQQIVDRVLVTAYAYTEHGPRATSYAAKSKAEIIGAQGSKYCPVDLSEVLSEIKNCDCRVAVIGTPCQIAGIRNIQRHDRSFADKIAITIGNFCGGIKNYHNISRLAKRNGISPERIRFFRFRGGGQPGSLLMATDAPGEVVKIPYPDYVGLTGIPKHLRCHLCVDATAELADISCGDAWLSRYLEDEIPWSFIVTRSEGADALMRRLIKTSVITATPATADDVITSQNENIVSKKVRQKSRMYLYRKLGYQIPVFDGGFFDNSLAVSREIKVFLKHRAKLLLEAVNLYGIIYKLYQRAAVKGRKSSS